MTQGLPIDPLQPRLLGGILRYQTREAFVEKYRDVLLRMKEAGQ